MIKITKEQGTNFEEYHVHGIMGWLDNAFRALIPIIKNIGEVSIIQGPGIFVIAQGQELHGELIVHIDVVVDPSFKQLSNCMVEDFDDFSLI